MKKILMTAAAICAALTIASCGAKEVDVTSLALSLVNEGQYSEQLNEVGTEVTEKRYGLDSDIIEVCSAYKGTNAVTDEVAVFKTTDTDAVNEKVQAYLENQIKSYESYRPSEVPKLNDAVLYTYNDVVIFCVSEDSDKTQQIISEYTEK